jgi:hypothetical protein
MQAAHDLRTQPRPRLGDTGFAGDVGLSAQLQPLETFQQTAQDLARRRLHIKAQDQDVVYDDVGRQIALPQTGFASRFKRRADRLDRNARARTPKLMESVIRLPDGSTAVVRAIRFSPLFQQ